MVSNTSRIIEHLPTLQKINDSMRLYEKVLGWKKIDNVLYGAFSQYPKNDDLDTVAFKTELVDSLYKCNLRMDKTKIAEEIVNKKLDLINDDLIKNVDTIAEIKPGHKRLGWVFSSKYCHFHHPLKYPITDSISKRGLRYLMYKRTFAYYDSYANFVGDIDLVRSSMDYNISYKDIDIYLYLLGGYLKPQIISSNVKSVYTMYPTLSQNLIP